jgi:phage shock protein A
MSMPMKFDTLQYATRLIEAGVPQAQAEAQSRALHEALSEGTVTPGDLLILKADIIARIEILKHDVDGMRHELDGVKQKVDDVKQKVDVIEQDVGDLKRRVATLSLLVWIGLATSAVQIGALAYIIGRLP